MPTTRARSISCEGSAGPADPEVEVARPAEVLDTGSIVDDLCAAILPIADMLSQPELAALLPSLLVEAANDASIRKTLDTFVAQSRQQAIDALERARRRGEIVPSTDPETLSFTNNTLTAVS